MEESRPQNPANSRDDEWRRLIEAWKTSGLTQQQFCEEHQLIYTAFVYWRTRLVKKNRPAKKKKLLPVKIASTTQNSTISCLRLRLTNGVVVEIGNTFPASNLKQLFDCLGVKM